MSARELILDAAAKIMHERGVAKATTKEIAREAGYSEATLYKHFADKQEIFISVLRERIPALEQPDDLVGRATVTDNLELLTAQLLRFYLRTFPMAASLVATPDLLVSWREQMAARNAGPQVPVRQLRQYLDAEVAAGRLSNEVDVDAVAALLCGAAMQQAFLAHFGGRSRIPGIRQLAASLVSNVRLHG